MFTDHLIATTGLSRLSLSNAYLVGTITSALLLPMGGRFLDRAGARVTALGATLLLGATLFYLSVMDTISNAVGTGTALVFAALVLGFVALRFSGQGMLTMVSRTMLGRWFDRRRGLVSGVAGVFMSFGFASAPIAFSHLIEAAGWQGAWRLLAVIVLVGMTLVAWAFFRDRPEDVGLVMDGSAASEAGKPHAFQVRHEMTRGQAIRTVAFWSVTAALSFQGLVITGITFHIVSLGAEAGLPETDAVSIFLPMAVLSTTTGLLGGVIADRTPVRLIVMAMMVLQAIGIFCFAQLGDPIMRWGAIAGMGLSGGFFGPLSTLALPRYFGRVHLGAIAGVQMMCLVVASAVGPSLLAVAKAWTDSYGPGLYVCLACPIVAIVLAVMTRDPQRVAASPP